MDGHYLAGVGDFSGDSEIAVIPEALVEAETYLKTSGDDDVGERVARIRKLIEGFETPYGMELLATVHWVGARDPRVRTVDDAIEAVHSWNERKRALLRKEHVELAWRRLTAQDWFRPRRPVAKHRLPFD
jgi:hypothetical protein